MPLSRDSRAERKVKAVLWAKFRLKQRLEAIDFQEDELGPIIEALKSGKSVMGIPEGAAFDIQIVSDDSDPNPNPDPAQ